MRLVSVILESYVLMKRGGKYGWVVGLPPSDIVY